MAGAGGYSFRPLLYADAYTFGINLLSLKDMKKFLLCLALFLGPFLLSGAKNPYDLDDNCYALFRKVESLVGMDGFDKANEEFLMAALQAGDTKAQTLYYVERLKNLTRLASKRTVDEAYDQKVAKAQEDVKLIADRFGYPQYFYYSYELLQNYYYNHGMPVKTMELINEMQGIAVKRGEEYGEWMGYRYLVALYTSMNDFISAKKYILQAIRIHENSSDPVVRRQSISRLYCDLADTYPIGADSVRINVRKAAAAASVHLDSLRVHYYLAKIASFDKDRQGYEEHKEYCLSDPEMRVVSSSAPTMFRIIDAVMDRTLNESYIKSVDSLSRIREIKHIANIAENYGFKDFGFLVEKKLVNDNERKIAEANQSQVNELNARYGNTALTADLAKQSVRVHRITRFAMSLVILILAGIIGVMVYHINSLRSRKAKDDKMIADLREANERVLVADAAKTRFVQNMSHEVRTPLNAIVGFSQLLSLPDGSFTPEEKEEFSGHIINNTKMLTMLLDDILSTSAMDSGKYKISIEEGECSFMCKAAISSAEHRLQPGVQMIFASEGQDPFSFRTDPRRVQQVLINLLTNACKHTTQGEIRIGYSLEENPGEVSFWVTDTGPGIPAEQAEKIFDRFTKLNEFVQGTGLGLSICRDIATRMGGRVFLDTSYTAGGARFVLALPVEPPTDNQS